MDKFSKEFYASRLEEWITKYIKLKEIRKLIKLIEKDIQINGGGIIYLSSRKSNFSYTPNFDKERISENKRDRKTIGSVILEDSEGLFNNDNQIFNTPLMYEINETFKEIEFFEYSYDIKVFLYFFCIEIHNIYIFYLSIEKDLFSRTNEHLYSRQMYPKMTLEQLLEELRDLTDIAYMTYSFYSYIDLNIEAIHQILIYFDEHFQILNNNVSLHKLFFNKYLSKKESDLKYILSFKIIIECSALIESYGYEIMSFCPNNKEMKTQYKELKEVLSYLIEKNTDRINEDIYEVYFKEQKSKNVISKNKKNLNIEIQNSYFMDMHQEDDFLKRLGEKEYDKDMGVKMTKKNKINILLLFIYSFIYSFFYAIPYLSFYFFYENKEIDFYHLGIILTSTHIGRFLSKILLIHIEIYKLSFIFFSVCFSLSFLLILSSEAFSEYNSFTQNHKKLIINIFNFISRFIYGISCGRIMTRKYMLLFLPESKIKYYSLWYIIITYLGLILGILFNFVTENYIDFNFSFKDTKIEEHLLAFFIGFILSILYLITIIYVFTEPAKYEQGMLKLRKFRSSINKLKNGKSGNLEMNENKQGKNNKDNSYEDYNNLSEENIYELVQERMNKVGSYESNKALETKNSDKESKVPKEAKATNINPSVDASNSSAFHILANQKEKNINCSGEPYSTSDLYCLNDKNKNNKIIEENEQNKIFSTEEIKGLNSLEKCIVNINQKNEYDDTNLLPNELERIKKTNFGSNKAYIKGIFVFVISLLLSNYINEFYFLSMPLCFIKYNKNMAIIILSLLQILSFPFLTFCRMFKAFNIERRFLLSFYIILFLIMIFFEVYKYKYGITLDLYVINVLLIFIFNNFIEGVTYLLSDKIIPTFVRILGINNKYILSYCTVIGKILGGISYYILCLMDNYTNNKFYEMNTIKFGSIIYILFTFVCIFILCCCYSSLRVRAVSKLSLINESF